MSDAVVAAVDGRIRAILEEGLDRMKTGRDKVTILAVGGGNFLIPDSLGGAAQVIRPPHAVVANAVGAAIAQVGAQVERVVSYDALAREEAIEQVAAFAREQLLAAGGDPASLTLADVEETYLSYLPGRAVQIRVRAVADLAFEAPAGGEAAAIGVPHEA